MRIGRRRQYLDGTLHKRQTLFHSISIDYAVSLNSQWTGLQRVDHEAVQQIMVACATSVRTSDSAPFISRLQQLHASLCAGPLRDSLGPGVQVGQIGQSLDQRAAQHEAMDFLAA